LKVNVARATTYAVVVALALLTLAAVPPVDVPKGGDSATRSLGAGSEDLPSLDPRIVVPLAGVDTVLVSGRISSNLYVAIDSCAGTLLPQRARWKLAWSMGDIFEYRVDMSRDLRDGDRFRLLVERTVAPGEEMKVGRVLATSFVLSRDTMTAIRFTPASREQPSADAAGDYYDPKGRSMRAAFLRAPLEFRRISSGFGMRLHPILGIWRQHAGTDYAAPQGTPVRAIGDGVVIFAGRNGGYGNMIDLRHPNGYVTRYGHLLRFAAGVHAGSRVTIGKTIAYVGMTGLATAPHLHFEVLVNGVQRDPRVALRDRGTSDPVPAADRAAFEATAAQLLAALDGNQGPLRTLALR
jgi:murein DD-endopeptidase MepM/ murein hydrolase activator NlpD